MVVTVTLWSFWQKTLQKEVKYMRKIGILAVIALPMIFLAFAGIAMADVAPHGGYGAGTDYCLTCHDVHDAAGDYVLTRDATVTETCATCHSLYGAAADNTWTDPKIDLVDGADATVAQYASVYLNTGANRVSGHGLGVALNGEPGRNDDSIPGGSVGLRVINSADYEEGTKYVGESVTDFRTTAGLYCASCHTPHATMTGHDTDGNGRDNTPLTRDEGNFGRQLVVDSSRGPAANKLLSSMPNHVETPVTDYNGFCMACHDKKGVNDGAMGSVHNHPPLCTSCHRAGNKGIADFPHTTGNQKLLRYDSDQNCTGCHGHVTAEGLNPLP
jgi:predicted CXXCH cytochrome family protein